MNETIQVVNYQGEEHLRFLGYLLKKQPISPAAQSETTLMGKGHKVEGIEEASSKDLREKGHEIEKRLIRQMHYPGAID